MAKRILITAKQRGSVNVVRPVAEDLIAKGYKVTIYATGNEEEARGFGNLGYKHISPSIEDYSNLVKSCDVVVSGLSGYNTPDGYFIREANKEGIPTIGMQDQNSNYIERLGKNPEDWPTLLAVMDKDCIEAIKNTFEEGEYGDELLRRTKIIGWVAFDHYAEMREKFSSKDKQGLLENLAKQGKRITEPIYFHATQNVVVDSDPKYLEYESRLTEVVFNIAADMGKKLIIKPHPQENTLFTQETARKYGHIFLPPSICNTQDLILSSYSITAGRSTCLTEACLLDKNTGGICPDLIETDLQPFPPLKLNAIPYTQTWQGVTGVLEKITSLDSRVNNELSEMRKRFSVDGKASERLVKLIENLL